MHRGSRSLRSFAAAVTVALAIGCTMSSPPAPPAPPPGPAPAGTLALTVTNRSGRAEPLRIYVLGESLDSHRLGHADAAGTFTPWTGGAVPPSPAPDVSIPGPAQGATTTIFVPRMSGRIYLSFGAALPFRLTPDGLVQPAPWVPGDPSGDVLFDWAELTWADSGLWLNSSQVDQFAVPHTVSVTGSGGATATAGELVPGGRQRVVDALVARGGDWPALVRRRADGTVLRVLSPGKGLDAGLFSPTYFDAYVAAAWDAYRSRDLVVAPFGDEPGTIFRGRTDGAGGLRFTDASGAVVASFARPSTRDVLGCDGRLAAPNDRVAGPIARTLCAALHRSTLGGGATEPSRDAAAFYTGPVADHYSGAIHAAMADGRAYGFAFDDVGGFESLVHDAAPRSAGIVLTPF
jgi:Beta-1,3-glucanase